MDSATIEVKGFLHMIQGDGEFGYARNTVIQRAPAAKTKSIIEKGLQSVLLDKEITSRGDKVLKVADLGCGVGPITLAFISTIIEIVQNKSKDLKSKDDEDDEQVPELQLFLNDLPSNDFNLLFKHLAELRLQFQERGLLRPWWCTMAVPGSFHGRLFPRNSLHFLHSNYALQWLSQVPSGLNTKQGTPINKHDIHLSESSPPTVTKAYLAQFRKDWFSFFSCRALEVVPGGRVVLVCRGRPSLRHEPIWELHLLNQAIASLVAQGVIQEEKRDTFNIPLYYPWIEDVKEVVEKEGSFEIEKIEIENDEILEEIQENNEKADIIAKCVRSFSESVVSHHFGDQVLDKLHSELIQVTLKYVMSRKPCEISSIVVLLKRRNCSKDL